MCSIAICSKCIKALYIMPSGNRSERPSQPPLKLRRYKTRRASNLHLLDMIAPAPRPRVDLLGSPNPSAREFGGTAALGKRQSSVWWRGWPGVVISLGWETVHKCAAMPVVSEPDDILKAQHLNVLLLSLYFSWEMKGAFNHTPSPSQANFNVTNSYWVT